MNAIKIEYISMKKDVKLAEQRIELYKDLRIHNYHHYKDHFFYMFKEYEFEKDICFITDEGNRIRIKNIIEQNSYVFYFFEIINIESYGDSLVFESIKKDWEQGCKDIFGKELDQISLEERMDYSIKYGDLWEDFNKKLDTTNINGGKKPDHYYN